MFALSVRSRLAAGVTAVAAMSALVSACSGGSNSVDQSAGGNFRYVGATAQGHTIPVGKRKTAGNATAPYLDSTKKFTLTRCGARSSC